MNKKLIYKNFHFIQIFFSIFVIIFLSILFILFKNNNLINNNSFLNTKATHNASKYNNQNNSKSNSLIFSNLVNDRKLNPMNSDWDQKNETFGSYMQRKFIDEQCNNMMDVPELWNDIEKCSEQEKQNAFRIDNYYYEALYTLSHNGKELFNVEDIVKSGGNLTEELELHVPFFHDLSFSVDLYDASIVKANFTSKNKFKYIELLKYYSEGSFWIKEGWEAEFKQNIDETSERILTDTIDTEDTERPVEWIIDYKNPVDPRDPENGRYIFRTEKGDMHLNSPSEDREIKIESLKPDYNSIIYNNNSSDSKNYMFDFDFTLEYKKKWLTNNKDHLNSPFIINPSYMFSSSHFNSSGEWKHNRAPMWIDFYFVNDDDSLELFETQIIENDIWEQDPEPNENLLHKHTFHVEDFVLESSSFEGKKKDSIIMELVTGPLGTQVSDWPGFNDSYFMSKKISIFNMSPSHFAYEFHFGSNYSDLNIEYLGADKNGYKNFKFSFEALIFHPKEVEDKKLIYKINNNNNNNNNNADTWQDTDFTFGDYEDSEIIDIKATINIQDSESIQFAVEGLTYEERPLYSWITPEIPLNTNIIFENISIREINDNRQFITSIEFHASPKLAGKKLWWSENYITGHNFTEYLVLSADANPDKKTYIIQTGINSIEIFIPIERLNIDNEETNFELSFILGYTEETSKTPPPLSNTTNSFYDKKVIGEDNKAILPKNSESPLVRMIKTLIILSIILSSFFALLFSSGIGILVRSNKQTRMVIASMDDDIFNADDMEEDFELSL